MKNYDRITTVFGDYYIGGRQFDRLETLISYYMFYSELVKDEKLLYPLAPSIICDLYRTYISIEPYLKEMTSDFNEEILYHDQIGQLFHVYHEIGEGQWYWAKSCDNNEYGLLFSQSVKQIVSKLPNIRLIFFGKNILAF